MRWLGLPVRIIALFVLATLLFLGLAIWPAAFLDRGSTGTFRVSLFPVALTLFDPFVWTCVRNSLLNATVVTAGSLALGLILGAIGTAWRYRGRSLLWALALVPMAAGPLLIAPAVGFSIGGERAWQWLEVRSILGFPLDEQVRWAALVWVGLATGAPIVALATSASLRKLEPAWLDAARFAGASRLRTWREIVWPIVRPDAAAACAAVYTLTLIEPAGPLVLGLNRTLARLIIDSATRLDQPTRPAALAALAILLTAIGRTLIGWWGGTSLGSTCHSLNQAVDPSGLRMAWLCRLIFVAWLGFAIGPLILLVMHAIESLPLMSSAAIELFIHDLELHRWLSNSITTAGVAFLIDLVIVRILPGPRDGQENRVLVKVANFLSAIPPLALGVGTLSALWLLHALGDLIGGLPRTWILGLVRELNPARSPGFLLILVVAAGKLALLVRVAELSRGGLRRIVIDDSRLMGVPESRAHLAGQDFWLGLVPGRAALLFLALASTNLAPALLMTPFSERRTVAPAILLSLVRDGSIEPRVGCAILAVLLWKITAFALASRSRAGSLGEWYRG